MLLIEESKNVFLGKIKVRSYLMNIRPGDFQIPVLWKSSTLFTRFVLPRVVGPQPGCVVWVSSHRTDVGAAA